MNILDQLKLKTEQVILKTDKFIRENGVTTGMVLGVAAVTAGVLGATAIGIASSPTLIGPGLLQDNIIANSISSFANFVNFDSGLTIMGIPMNLAGASLIVGGSSGLLFSTFSKLYKEVKNKDVFHDTLTGLNYVKCINNEGKTIEVPAMKFYEMIENNTLKYNYKEVIHNSHIGNGFYEEKKYPSANLTIGDASIIQGEPDIDKIRRLLFTNTKDIDFASKLSEKMKSFRSGLNDNNNKLSM